MMLVLVTYDVATTTAAGRRRLQHVAKACLDYGQRVQNSVFECQLDSTRWAELEHRLLQIIDPGEDSLRCYFLGSNWKRRVEHYGAKPSVDVSGPLIA
jgi:CRISPR-associated protein Cas2